MDEVAAEFFPKQSRFRSFERQLNGWGFQRLDSVAGKRSAWYHRYFDKKHPELLEHITRVTPFGKDTNSARAQTQIQLNMMAGESMMSTFILDKRAASFAYKNTMSHPSVSAQSDEHAADVEHDIATMLQSIVDDADDIKETFLSSFDPSNPVQSRRSDAHAANIATVVQSIENNAEGIDNDFLSFLDDNDGVDTIFAETVSSSKSGAHHAPSPKSHVKCFPLGLYAVLNAAETMGHENAISW